MRLTVLSVAFPFAPVGPDAVGGAEQVLAQLDAALVRAGHRSVVVACAGSSTAGTLVATPRATGAITDAVRRRAHAAHRRAIERALRRWPVDLVHMHGIDFHAYLPPPGPPVLVTLHLPPEWYPPEAFHPERPNTFLHCVSASQRARCPRGARLLPEVPNGVALDALDARHARRRFALALGRICPEKGFHIALDAARRAGVPLLLAGKTFPYEAHETYFAREIAPRLDRQPALHRPGRPRPQAPPAQRRALPAGPDRWRRRPARSWRWRRSPAARRWSRSRPARCRRSSSTAGPGSSCATRQEMAAAIHDGRAHRARMPAGRRRGSASRSSARSGAISHSTGTWRSAAGPSPFWPGAPRALRLRPMPALDIEEVTTGAGARGAGAGVGRAVAPRPWSDAFSFAGLAAPLVAGDRRR